MNSIYNNKEYINEVCDILESSNFNKLKNNRHHGLTRFDHSLRVSYYSYKLSKALKLNSKEVARAGLLHDYFDNSDLTEREQKLSAFYHPFKAIENATNEFYLSDMEKDIIISHMFPMIPQKIPKYAESWLVSLVDKTVATYEFVYSYSKILSYKFANVYVLILLIGKYL